MVELVFMPIDANYKIEKGRAVIYLYGRTKSRRIAVRYDKFEPYFLVIPKKGKTDEVSSKLTNYRLDIDGREAVIHKTEIVERTLKNLKIACIKCYTSIPKDVPKLSTEISKLDNVASVEERDVKFINRFLSDTQIKLFQWHKVIGEPRQTSFKVPVIDAESIKPAETEEPLPQLKILAFDIETGAKDNSPAKNAILMLSVYSENVKKVITWQHIASKKTDIEVVEDERAMIQRFGQILEEEKPDIICGYYSDVFDLAYIRERSDILGAGFAPGLNNTSVQLKSRRNKECYIEGIVHVDVFKFIRFIWAQGLETNFYDLDSVANELLNEGKDKVELNDLLPAWRNGSAQLSKFADYNLRDSELCYKLCDKILPDIIELSKLTAMTPFQVTRSRFSKLVEGYLIQKASQLGIIIPHLPSHEEIKARRMESYQGAFVYEPKPGKYERIVVFDFRSLYPTIIISHNISPETLRCECCKDAAKRVPGRSDLWFCEKQLGFIPKVIKELVTRRIRLKGIIKKSAKPSPILLARSYALKTLANSMYGYLGFFGSRWYSFDSALSITAYGRYYLNMVIEKAKSAGFEVLYGDTDSIFIHLGERTLEQAKNFVDKINGEVPEMIELQYQGYYPRGIFVSMKDATSGAKKKYALLGEQGNIIIKGFETVRRNWSLLAKEAQRQVLEIILKEDNVGKALDYIKNLVDDVTNNRIAKEKMVIRTQIQKPIEFYESIAPHVAVAKKLIQLGHNVEVGQIINYIVLAGSGRVGERAEPAELVENPDYDTDYYVKNQIVPAVESIFRELGVDIVKELSSKDQSKLNSFFS